MSFDLYFLARRGDQSWEDAMADLEEAASDDPQPLSGDALATWDRIKESVRAVVPAAEEFVGDTNRELSDHMTGIQVSWFGAELSLTVPYWHSGPDAERIVALLREIAVRVEQATGLTAYDPQADAPFMGDADQEAAGTMDRVVRSVEGMINDSSTAPAADNPPPEMARPTSMWSRLFRPKRD